MAGIQGITGVPEPRSGTRTEGRSPAPAPSTAPTTDGVEISPEAAQAAGTGVVVGSGHEEIRLERVAEARQRLEEGAHHLQEVVLSVAARLSKFVE